MPDFVYNAPGTVTNPLVPAGMTIFGNGLASTAVGVHGHSGANPTAFCDSRAYGNVVDITMTMAQVNAGGDDWFIGVVILSGPDAGAMSGLYIQSVDCILASFTAPVASTKTNIGSSVTTITAAANDVFALRMTLAGGIWTFSNFTQNGSALALVGATTSSTYGSEPAWAAGGWLDCGNTNNTFFSQFTGNGVSASLPEGQGGFMSPGISSPC